MDLTLLVVPKPVECTVNNFTSSNNCKNNTLERKAQPLCGSLIGLCDANHRGLVCGAGLWLGGHVIQQPSEAIRRLCAVPEEGAGKIKPVTKQPSHRFVIFRLASTLKIQMERQTNPFSIV